MASNHYKLGIRRIIRSGDIAGKTNRAELDENQKKVSDFIQLTSNKLQMALSEEKNKKNMNLNINSIYERIK